MNLAAAQVDSIVPELLAGGYSPETPCAVVAFASWPQEKTIRCTLGTLADHGIPLVKGGKFSQQDIADGIVTYQSNGEGADSFAFSVASGTASPITGTLTNNANNNNPTVCAIGMHCVLGVLRSANFNVTTDQSITIRPLSISSRIVASDSTDEG